MIGAQPLRAVGVALDAQLQRPPVEATRGEHVAADLEHRYLVAERKILQSLRQRQASGPELVAFDEHLPSRARLLSEPKAPDAAPAAGTQAVLRACGAKPVRAHAMAMPCWT